MEHELREFCEDNNQVPPAALESVPPVRELIHWSPADPALENESAPGLRLASAALFREVFLQRVVYDIRYALWEHGRFVSAPEPEEIGDLPNLATALELARAWLDGASFAELPHERRPFV